MTTQPPEARGLGGPLQGCRGPTPTIVLIDDDRSWSQSAVALLRSEGFEVTTAEDGRRGLEVLEQTAPLLVILDAHMPRLNGLEVLRELRRRDRGVPVLMVSGEDQAALMARALAEGASSFLRKPVGGELLLRAVRRLTGASGVGRAC
jgi:DNA-binding response OmpR family regulator